MTDKRTKEEISEYNRNYYAKNRDKLLKYSADNYKYEPKQANTAKRGIKVSKRTPKMWYADKRKEFLNMYGNRCACCGETIPEFLTIEHIEGQKGKVKEASHKAYRNAVKEYRPDIYEILCYNCNCSKGNYGKCPHKSLKND